MRPFVAASGSKPGSPLPFVAALLALVLLASCATLPPDIGSRLDTLFGADIILIGEQHDAPEHQALQQAAVTELALRGSLAALAIEMAEQGRSTAGLPPSASESQVRDSLAWAEAGWAWDRYGPVVMAAVRAGVPVLGANLPRSAMRSAMGNEGWDRQLGPDALARQREDIRAGHCNLLPAQQIAPMARIQIARDAAMAATLSDAARPGKVVVLVAGGAHVLRETGVPVHLPTRFKTRVVLAVAGGAVGPQRNLVDVVWHTAPIPFTDHCAGLQRSLTKP